MQNDIKQEQYNFNVIVLSLFLRMDFEELLETVEEGQQKLINSTVHLLINRLHSLQQLKRAYKEQQLSIMQKKKKIQKCKKKFINTSKMHQEFEKLLDKFIKMRNIIKEDPPQPMYKNTKQIYISDLLQQNQSSDIQCSNCLVGKSDSGFYSPDNQSIFLDQNQNVHSQLNKQTAGIYKFSKIEKLKRASSAKN